MKLLLPNYLVLLPVVALAFYIVFRKKEVTPVYFTRAQILKRLGLAGAVNIAPYVSLAVLSLLFIALLRPAKGIVRKEDVKNARDIFIVMDTSLSMNAVDMKPNRITAAKKCAKQFIEKRPHDRVGLVVFGGAAYIHCPLTFDHASVLKLVDEIKSGMTGKNGTAIGDGVAVALKHLAKSTVKSKIIILLTDGANNSGVMTPEMSSELAQNLSVRIYTVGIGVRGEAKIPVNDPVFGRRLVRIKDELNEPLLRNMASKTSGKYFRAASGKELSEIYATINKLEATKVMSSSYMEYREMAGTIMWLAFAVFCIGSILRFSVFRRIP